jgi:hypothetical protein
MAYRRTERPAHPFKYPREMNAESIEKLLARQNERSIKGSIRFFTSQLSKEYVKMADAKLKLMRFEKGHRRIQGQLAEVDHWLTEIDRQLGQAPAADLEEILVKKRQVLQLRRQTLAARPYSDGAKLNDLSKYTDFLTSMHDNCKQQLDALVALKAEKGW